MTTLFIYGDLEKFEGRKHKAYQDTLGNWTIGVGHHDHNLHAGVIWPDSAIDSTLRADVANVQKTLDGSPIFKEWWREMLEPRQDALVNMGFNMGVATLATFGDFLQLLRVGLYEQAADDALHTLWAKQVGLARSQFVTGLIKTGVRK